MVVYKKRKVESALLKKGFEKQNKKHKFYFLYVNGYDVGRHTRMSHGGKEISDFHIKSMAKQIGIEKTEFIDLIDCPLNQENLIKILKENDLIPKDL